MTPQQLVAFQLIVRAITDLPAQVAAANLDAARQQPAAPESVEPEPGSRFDTAAFGREQTGAKSAAGKAAQNPLSGSPLAPPGARPQDARDVGTNPAAARAGEALQAVLGGGAKVAGAALSGLGTFALALGAKFVAVAGPAAVLGAALQSPISGFQVLGKSVQLLGTALAPVLLPATVLAATALTALSDVLLATLMPGMEGFFGVIMGLGVPAIIVFIDAVRAAAEWLEKYAKYAPDPGDSPLQMWAKLQANSAAAFGDVLGDVGDFLARGPTAGVSLDRVQQGIDGTERTDGKTSSRDLVTNALRDVMGSLRNSISPRAVAADLGGIGRSARLAALNNDPLEARMLRTQQAIYVLLERAIGRVENQRGVYGPGDGDFGARGDMTWGAGGAAGGDL